MGVSNMREHDYDVDEMRSDENDDKTATEQPQCVFMAIWSYGHSRSLYIFLTVSNLRSANKPHRLDEH